MFETIIRPDLLDSKSYQSTAIQEESLALHLNESSFQRTLPNIDLALNRYPRTMIKVRQEFAKFYGIKDNQIQITASSDEGINLLIRLCCRAGVDSILVNTPAFPMYAGYAKFQGASVISVPLIEADNFALDLKGITEKIFPTTKLIFICSPNNPTGTLADTEAIIQLAKTSPNTLVVVDEAYIEFSELGSLTPLIDEYPNIVILRTLSKAHALAGIRFGAILGNANLIQYCLAISSPFPISTPTLAAAEYAITDAQWKKTQAEIAIIQTERSRLLALCKSLPLFTKVYPSQANFLYLECPQAAEFTARCAEHGILIKNMQNAVRITISTPQQNQRWIELC